MSVNGFNFEGRDTTARKLKAAGIAYSEGAIQSALEAGATDTKALVAHCERSRAINMRRSYAQADRARQEFQVRRKKA